MRHLHAKRLPLCSFAATRWSDRRSTGRHYQRTHSVWSQCNRPNLTRRRDEFVSNHVRSAEKWTIKQCELMWYDCADPNLSRNEYLPASFLFSYFITGQPNDLTYLWLDEFNFTVDNPNAPYSSCDSRIPSTFECWQHVPSSPLTFGSYTHRVSDSSVNSTNPFIFHASHTWRLAPLCTFNYDFTHHQPCVCLCMASFRVNGISTHHYQRGCVCVCVWLIHYVKVL